MRANTTHYVYTQEDSIFLGNHFYTTSTLHESLYGLTHCLMGDQIITNTSHAEAVLLLLRLLHYFYVELVLGHPDFENLPGHLPDPTTYDGFLDLTYMCALALFFNVLDPRTFQVAPVGGSEDRSLAIERYNQYDLNAIPEEERNHFAYARGLSRQLIEWLDAYFQLEPQLGPPRSCMDFYIQQVLHHGVFIIRYRMRIDEEDEGSTDEEDEGSSEEDDEWSSEEENEDSPIGCENVPRRLREMPMISQANVDKQVKWALQSLPAVTNAMWEDALASLENPDLEYMRPRQEGVEHTPVICEPPSRFEPIPLTDLHRLCDLGTTAGDDKYFKAPVGYPIVRGPSPREPVRIIKRSHSVAFPDTYAPFTARRVVKPGFTSGASMFTSLESRVVKSGFTSGAAYSFKDHM